MNRPSGPLARKPPLNGSFPLDHAGECKQLVSDYLACLQRHGEEQTPCQDLIQQYLRCRKAHGLLKEHDAAVWGIDKAEPRQ